MSSSSVRYTVASLCATVLLVGTLAGCSAQESRPNAASQVAVKVNKGEISVHQVNDVLSRSGNIPQDQIDNARAATVERLIEQELLVQQAMISKLDRNPNVLQLIEFSRREILARAYGEQIANGAPKPTEAQIAAFYDENPALFSKRRIYSLQEVHLQLTPDRFDAVRTRLQSGGSLQELTTWFNEQGIPFGVNTSIRPAEQIPLEMLRNLSQLNAGQAAFVRTPAGALLIFVVGTQDEPVDRGRAKPVIENFLLAQARGESVRAELKRLREAATINYMGGFSPPAAAEAPPAAEQGPVISPEASPDPVRSAIEQGGIRLR